MRVVRLLAVMSFAACATLSSATPIRVKVEGRSAADRILQTDILHTITLYGALWDCPAPTSVRVSKLNSSMIPPTLRKPSLEAAYEEWNALFCGKRQRFFVSFWPDPAGGSMLSVQYPYPTGAPTGVLH